MTLKTYIEHLNRVAKENPSALDLEVVTSADDEGNSFSKVIFAPCRGKLDGNNFEAEAGLDNKDEINAVCVNLKKDIMGACEFSNLEVVKGNASDAYSQACEKMNEYNGHQEGYSGDIQTTDGFYMGRNAPRFGTKSFIKWEDKEIDNTDKRGSCCCVEIIGAGLKRMKEGRGLKGKKGYRAFYFFGWGAC